MFCDKCISDKHNTCFCPHQFIHDRKGEVRGKVTQNSRSTVTQLKTGVTQREGLARASDFINKHLRTQPQAAVPPPTAAAPVPVHVEDEAKDEEAKLEVESSETELYHVAEFETRDICALTTSEPAAKHAKTNIEINGHPTAAILDLGAADN